MSVTATTTRSRKPKNFPLYRTLPGFLRDPLREIERIGRTANGAVLRLDLGGSKPYVVTHPDDVQTVLKDESDNYVRDGVFWRPLHGLMGDSILGEGELWAKSRRVLMPVFTAKNISALTGRLADTINEAMDELVPAARDGRPVAAGAEMARIVNQTVIRVFFGEKILPPQIERLGPAFEAIATHLAFRFLLPFVPDSVPMPGDRAYREAVRVMDDVMYELVDLYRDDPGEGHDIFTALCRARTAEGSDLGDRWIRDNLVAMFATGTETTATALSWLWPLISDHPEVAARLRDEIDRVVGDGRVAPHHLQDLVYTKQVVSELLRLYPVGWLFPRMAVRTASLRGVTVKAGQALILSPYLTHRLDSVWDRPAEFDPGRFAPERTGHRHRYAYFPFGGGPHQCIGMNVFHVEAQLIIAAMLGRFRPEPLHDTPSRPRIGPTLRPEHDLELRLVPNRTPTCRKRS
ncbi:cytochrome P450 [Actinomadura sp. 9N215]|uniref:cytochrome P450 n=1 Tax=Actinomadura sp. 9N215 TaxID=3375150 RepID=UPI0037AE653A